jgi:hypothetical protein
MRTVRITNGGIQPLGCEACRELNKVQRTQYWQGTVFVPISLRVLARLEAGEAITGLAKCHQEGHLNKLRLVH